MGWTKYQGFLALLMVTTGSLNTLTTKWADRLESKGSDGKVRQFDHPFVQACFMFFGEFLCLITFKLVFCLLSRRGDGSEERHHLVKGNRSFSAFLLLPPALCDMTATSIMYTGLTLTYASSFQMLRGSVIVFVALLSFFFLERRFNVQQWSGITLIIIGLGTVGASDFLANDNDSSKGYTQENIIIGDILIVIAQMITSVQMVYEERYVGRNDIPSLQAVGWEGFFGFITLATLLVPMYFIHVPAPFNNNARGVIEDAPDAIIQILNNPFLIMAISGTIVSIAFFNFAGISVTKELSATSRMVLDSVRTMVIWIVSIQLGWQNFHLLQIFGFISLLMGMMLYNNVVIPQIVSLFQRITSTRSRDEMEEPIISSTPADEVRNEA